MGAARAVRQFLDALDRAAEAEGDAGMFERVAQARADILVEAAQDVVAAMQHRDRDAEPAKRLANSSAI